MTSQFLNFPPFPTGVDGFPFGKGRSRMKTGKSRGRPWQQKPWLSGGMKPWSPQPQVRNRWYPQRYRISLNI